MSDSEPASESGTDRTNGGTAGESDGRTAGEPGGRTAGDRLLAPGDDRSLLVDAVLGAIVTTALSFVPFSPVLGGVLAGYLHRDDSVLAGAASGLVASLPSYVVVLFVLPLLPFGFALGGPGAAVGGSVLVAFLFVGLLVFTAVTAVLGALGGFAGGWLAEEYPEPPW